VSRSDLRVAYVINQYPKLSHSFVRREIRALEAHGIHVSRLTIRRPDETLRNASDRDEAARTTVLLEHGGFAIVMAALGCLARSPGRFARALFAAVVAGWRSQRGLPVHLVYLLEACWLRGWLERERIDHVHAHFGTNAAMVALLARRLGGPPYSFTAHGPEEFDHPTELSLPRKIREAAFTVGVSEFGRSQLARWSDPSDWDRIEVVRCGVDRALLDSPPAPPVDAPRLVSVGRLCVEKAQHVLVDAAACLHERGIDFELLIGGEGPLRPELERRIARAGLGDRITLVGALDEAGVLQAIQSARAMVLPSFAEGLPVVIMEALALHRPVVTTPVAGIPELVVDGECGWLVPAGSVPGLTAALEQVLAAEPAALGQMGANGAARVARLHDVDREASRLARAIRRSAAGSGGH
jgi:colanic acid/amylovoran biosynthesis glycosyltransferase